MIAFGASKFHDESNSTLPTADQNEIWNPPFAFGRVVPTVGNSDASSGLSDRCRHLTGARGRARTQHSGGDTRNATMAT